MDKLTPRIAPTSGAMTPETPTIPIFLVQESDFLVAEDIVGSLQSLGPCRAILVRHPIDVSSALASEHSVSAAFLEVPYVDVLNMKLDKILNELGALIILTTGADDECQVRSVGWGVLVRPFTEQMIHKELKGPRD